MEKDYVVSHRDKIELLNPAHITKYLPIESIYVGTAADMFINSGEVTAEQINNFKVRVLEYYKTMYV